MKCSHQDSVGITFGSSFSCERAWMASIPSLLAMDFSVTCGTCLYTNPLFTSRSVRGARLGGTCPVIFGLSLDALGGIGQQIIRVNGPP